MMRSDSPLVARIVLGIVAAMALAIPFGITLHEAHALGVLEQTARTTDGRVTKKNCANHGRLAYAYVVDTRVYRGAGTMLGKSCDDVKVGDSIDIIYSAQEPALSRCDSLAAWRHRIDGSFFALALLGLTAAVIIVRMTRIDVETRTGHPR